MWIKSSCGSILPILTKVAHVKSNAIGVYCGRKWGKYSDSLWGNPFHIGKDGTRDEVIERYRKYFYGRIAIDKVFKEETEKLRGKTLLCWCYPKKCHCDVIAEYLNG